MNIKVAFVLFLFTLFSCIKSNVGDVNFDEITLTPEYAFPVGQHSFYFNDFSRITNLTEIDDVLNPPIDSVFYYNNQYYYLPNEIKTDLNQEFTFGDQNKLDIIESFSIRTNVTSQIPGEIFVQVYFMQQDDTLDHLYFTPFEITGPNIDGDGNIESTNLSTSETSFISESRISNILNTDNLNIETRLIIPSYTSVNVVYTDSLELGVQIAVKIKLNIPPNEN